MKKTQSISIASTPFWIEEDAYQALEQYLSGIKAHFARGGAQSEIVSDIEARIAEQFVESKKNIITLHEVHAVIASMGKVEDFGDDKKDAHGTQEDSPQGKRLYRNPDDKVIAGVASGIAAYVGVDVVWVRLAFVALTLATGFGIALYVVLWICIPEATGASQRLEMSGMPVTVETLAERVKDRVGELKRERGLARLLAIPFTILGRIFQFIFTKVFPVIGKILGVLVSLGAALALLALSVAFGLMLTHSAGEYLTEFPLGDILSQGTVAFVSTLAYLASGIPFCFLFFLGATLVTRRRILGSTITFTLLGVWFLSLVVGAVMGISIAARVASYVKTDPAYQETERTITIAEPLTEIVARNGVAVVYTQDVQATTTTLTLSGRVKDMEHLAPSVQNGVLTLEPQRQTRDTKFCIFCNFYSVPSVAVTAPNITRFTGENGTRISAQHVASASRVTISLSNGTYGAFDMNAREIVASLKNAARLDLSGKTTQATFSAENGAYIGAFDLLATHATLDVLNSSRIDIGGTQTLDVKARNGAVVRYVGTTTLTQDVKNAARVERYDENQ